MNKDTENKNLSEFIFIQTKPEAESWIRLSEFIVRDRWGDTRAVATVRFDSNFDPVIELHPKSIFYALSYRAKQSHVLVCDVKERLTDSIALTQQVQLYIANLEREIDVFVGNFKRRFVSPEEKYKYRIKASIVVDDQAEKNYYLQGWKKQVPEDAQLVNAVFGFFSDGSVEAAFEMNTTKFADEEERVIYYFLAEIGVSVLKKGTPEEVFNAIDGAMKSILNGETSYSKKGEGFTVEYSVEKYKADAAAKGKSNE